MEICKNKYCSSLGYHLDLELTSHAKQSTDSLVVFRYRKAHNYVNCTESIYCSFILHASLV